MPTRKERPTRPKEVHDDGPMQLKGARPRKVYRTLGSRSHARLLRRKRMARADRLPITDKAKRPGDRSEC